MTEKSYVTLEQRVCPVCGTTHDTGALLLDRRLRNTFERNTVTGYALCPPCEQLHKDGYVAFVECTQGHDGMKLGDAIRTGQIAHVRRSIIAQVLNTPIDPELPMVFVEVGVIAKLQSFKEKA